MCLQPTNDGKELLIDQLVQNTISHHDLNKLMQAVTNDDLKEIVVRIFDTEESDLLKKSTVEGALKNLNNLKKLQRNDRYYKKIRKATAGDQYRKIVVEGDSWFCYPVILSDVIDWISMEDTMAVFSIAAGGDWLLNMLAAREYVDGLAIHQPDFFLMSGGGNDIGGLSRVALMVNCKPLAKSEFDKNEWAKYIIDKAQEKPDPTRWNKALPYLSKDFFALLMLFRLQFYTLFYAILVKAAHKYPDLKIITQGYDFLIPSFDKRFGLNPLKWFVPAIRLLLGHGKWLKTPLKIKGIYNSDLQKDIIYALIFLFNEMMIELEDYFANLHQTPDKLFHIDSRGLIRENEWTDEIHPQPDKFKIIAKTYIDCMNARQRAGDYKNVYRSINRQ